MNRTKIDWVKNPDGTPGYTWNPITGCLNGCSYCYAKKLANGRLRERYLAGGELAPLYQDGLYPSSERDLRLEAVHDPFYPRLWPERLALLETRNRVLEEYTCIPQSVGVFVCDMSDLFGIGVPEEWTRRVTDLIWDNWKITSRFSASYDRFYLLTKQYQNLPLFSPFPDNCWVGVSATNMKQFYDLSPVFNNPICSRGIRAKIKFISFEPLLEPVICKHEWIDKSSKGNRIGDRRRIMPIEVCSKCGKGMNWNDNTGFIGSDGKPIVQWVIIGAQTKPYKPPRVEWVREIVQACDKAGTPVFLKDNLGWPKFSADGALPFYKRHPSGTMELRQEVPSVS